MSLSFPFLCLAPDHCIFSLSNTLGVASSSAQTSPAGKVPRELHFDPSPPSRRLLLDDLIGMEISWKIIQRGGGGRVMFHSIKIHNIVFLLIFQFFLFSTYI